MGIMINIINLLEIISSNKYFIGLSMLFMNLGSRYIEINLTKSQEIFLKKIAKEIMIFTICFIGTRDILTSIIITSVFYICFNYILNENSNLCPLPTSYKKLNKTLDINNDNYISQEEINNAILILEKAKNQENLYNQVNMINSLSDNF